MNTKFRGYGLYDKKWHTGYYYKYGNKHFIIKNGCSDKVEVFINTVGRFLLTNNKGQDIYEGDILKDNQTVLRYIVRYGEVHIKDNEGYGDNLVIGFYLEVVGGSEYSRGYKHLDGIEKMEKVGNIYNLNE